MSEQLIETLKKLDPENAAHWVKADGLPAVQVVSMLHGFPVTREDITTAAPDLKKDNAKTYFGAAQAPAGGEPAPGGVATTEQPAGSEPAPALPTASTVPTEPTVATDPAAAADLPSAYTADLKDVHGDKSVVELLRAELAELDEGVAQLNRVQDELNAQRKKLNAERDDILNRITELTVSDEVDANQGYFAAQQRLREQKAEQVKAWKESGLTLKQIQAVIPQKSPIDRALAGARKG